MNTLDSAFGSVRDKPFAAVSQLLGMAVITLALCLLGAGKAQALDGGYLLDSQLANGSISRQTDTATRFQSTAQAVAALAQLSQLDGLNQQTLSDFIVADEAQSSEHLSLRILAHLAMGVNVDADVRQLLTRQNADGGFATYSGLSSTAFDTALALEALALSNQFPSIPVALALGYLQQQQDADGAWRFGGEPQPSVEVTAVVLQTLRYFTLSYSVGPMAKAAQLYLLDHKNADGYWQDARVSAEVLQALLPITTDTALLTQALDFLNGSQQTNLSWQDDVYVTAVVLQTLFLAANAPTPNDPVAAVLSGKIVDAGNGQALTAATVTLIGNATFTTQTDANGLFSLINLPADSYTAYYRANDYVEKTQALVLASGQRVQVGTVTLAAPIDRAIISGVVRSGDDGTAVAGALIQLSGADNRQLNSDSEGRYRLSSLPGAITLQVSAAGYDDTQISAEVAAAHHIHYDPRLYTAGQTPQNPTSVFGVIVDQDSGQPVADATIAVIDTALTTQSDATGAFAFSQLAAGQVQLHVSGVGYRQTSVSLLVDAGAQVDSGSIALQALSAEGSSVSGKVIDSETSEPISGAVVQIADQRVTTDANGSYFVEKLSQTTLNVSVSATGYLSLVSQITVSQVGQHLQFDYPLQSAVTGGVAIAALNTDRSEYPAYQQVSIQTSLKNESNEVRVVRLYVSVFDEQNELIAEYPAVAIDDSHAGHNHHHAPPAEAILTLQPHSELIAPAANWHTDAHPPGQYQLVIQAIDPIDGRLLAQRSSSITILNSQTINTAILTASPDYATEGTNMTVDFQLQVIHHSNVSFNREVNWQVIAPDGQSVYQGQHSFGLNPQQTHVNISLGQAVLSALQPGQYQLQFDSINGTPPDIMQSRHIYVAPGTRVEISQGLSPAVVTPQGDKILGVTINLEGKTQ